MTITRYTVSPPWLAGGIDAAHCIAAYVPRGAHSYNDSLVNRAAPGMFTLSDVVNDYDCEPQTMTPDWSTAAGWEFINPRTDRRQHHHTPASESAYRWHYLSGRGTVHQQRECV